MNILWLVFLLIQLSLTILQDLEKYPRTLENDVEKIKTICPNCISFCSNC